MNDRYLFKAKRKNWKELTKEEWWVQGNVIYDGVAGQYFMHAYGNSMNESDKVNEDGCSRFVAYEIDADTICQCIGLKDKNGTPIWENDLVTTPREDGYSLICWNDTEAKWEMHNEVEGIVLDFDNYWSNEIEVVGNISDNPELLKVE